MCLAQGPQHSDAGEAQTRDPSSGVKHSTTEPLHSHSRSYTKAIASSVAAKYLCFKMVCICSCTKAIASTVDAQSLCFKMVRSCRYTL